MNGTISKYLDTHFKHFNAGTLVRAAQEYKTQIKHGNKMMITLAGAMSTAELGKSLAEMIRQDKVQCITCTGANLEEDIFNLVAHNHYKLVPNYRDLSPKDEEALLKKQLNRVTDTCIPEHEAMRKIEEQLKQVWDRARDSNERYFPHEYIYQILANRDLEADFQIDPSDSWVYAAYQKNISILVPGWEDSTCGNMFTAHCMRGIYEPTLVKGGIEYMMSLIDWYKQSTTTSKVGFFQIGGGIAGDFPICVVPLLSQDMEEIGTPVWSYFCQISDSTTSYGSYSGAVPNEKITWGKLHAGTPRFVIESDATIVAPLLFAYVLDW